MNRRVHRNLKNDERVSYLTPVSSVLPRNFFRPSTYVRGSGGSLETGGSWEKMDTNRTTVRVQFGCTVVTTPVTTPSHNSGHWETPADTNRDGSSF